MYEPKMNWRRGNSVGIVFKDKTDYYSTLGLLANKNGYVVAYYHKNQNSGAWGGQGKLEKRKDIDKLPYGLDRSFRKSGDNRISVTEYFKSLKKNHSFTIKGDENEYTYYLECSDLQKVLETVPIKYQSSFLYWYNL